MKRLCLLLGGHFSNAQGGAEYQAMCIAEELVRKGGFEIYYLAHAIDPDYRPEGYRLVQISERNAFNKHAFFFDAPALYRTLRRIRPDLIYQRCLLAYTGIAAYYARRHNCRLMFHVASDLDLSGEEEGEWSAGRLLKRIDRTIGEYGVRRADAIVAQTRRQAELLAARYGRSAEAVIGNFHPLPRERVCKEEPVKVVWVANLKPNKRPELFVRLAEDLAHLEGVEFIMIGHPGNRRRYAGLYERMERLGNFRFLGLRPMDEVNAVLASGHVFVNTSVAEGFPNTFVQAWMRRVPVVSLDVDLDGVLAAGRIGLLSRSYEQLKRDVMRLISDQALREAMGEEACRYATENHSPALFEKLYDLFRRYS